MDMEVLGKVWWGEMHAVHAERALHCRIVSGCQLFGALPVCSRLCSWAAEASLALPAPYIQPPLSPPPLHPTGCSASWCTAPPQIPLNIAIREQSDAGAPIVAVEPDSAAAQVRGGKEGWVGQLGLHLLSRPALPLHHLGIRNSCTPAAPAALTSPLHPPGRQAYVSVAERVWAKLQQSGGGEGGGQARGPPKIVFE